jgi:hypothetical protein
MRINIYYYVCISLLVLFCSCEKKSEEPGNNQLSVISSIDVISAKALVIKSDAGIAQKSLSTNKLHKLTSESTESTNKLYKLTEEGYLLEVTYKDENGNMIQSDAYTPVGVFNTPSDFVIIEYGNPHQYIIANTQTGAAHVLWDDSNNVGRVYLGPYGVGGKELQEDVPFERDDARNLYMIISSNSDGKGALYRLNVSDMTLERLTPDIYNVTSFLIDGQGNVLFGGMFRLANGTFYRYEDGAIIACWNGNNRKIFALCEVTIGYQNEWPVKGYIVVRFDIHQDIVVPQEIENDNFVTNYLYEAFSIQYQRYKTGSYPYREYALTDYSGNTFCFDISSSGDNIPYNSADGKIKEINTPAVPLPAGSTHYSPRWENGKLQFVAWSPNEFDKKYIYWKQPANADVRNFSLGQDGIAYVSLFEYSSARYVLYRIKPDGSKDEIDSESYSSIVTLTALN